MEVSAVVCFWEWVDAGWKMVKHSSTNASCFDRIIDGEGWNDWILQDGSSIPGRAVTGLCYAIAS